MVQQNAIFVAMFRLIEELGSNINDSIGPASRIAGNAMCAIAVSGKRKDLRYNRTWIPNEYESNKDIYFFKSISRTIITFTLEPRAHTSVRNAVNCSGSAHRFQCTGKSCTRSENLGLAQIPSTELNCFVNQTDYPD